MFSAHTSEQQTLPRPKLSTCSRSPTSHHFFPQYLSVHPFDPGDFDDSGYVIKQETTHLDHPPDDELATLGAAWREEDVEVVLTILPPVELIEDPVGERAEALGAHEARGVKELPVRVDNLGFGLKAIVTTRAGDALQVHDARHPVEEVGALALGHWGGEDKQLSGSVLGRHCCCCPDVLLSGGGPGTPTWLGSPATPPLLLPPPPPPPP